MSRLKIFNYHNVAAPPSDARMIKLYVAPEQFERQCRMLQRLGLQGVSLTEGLRALQRGDSGRCVALTFDDGYADNLECAAPILKQFGFRATCYVVAARIGAYNDWDAAKLGVRKPLMSGSQLQRWLAEGHEIGSHTLTHPFLNRIAPEAAEQEIHASRVELARLTGADVDHFCYPYGEFDDATIALVRAAGYKSAVSTMRGVANQTSDRFRLPRISINGDKGLLKFALKAATPYASVGRRRAA